VGNENRHDDLTGVKRGDNRSGRSESLKSRLVRLTNRGACKEIFPQLQKSGSLMMGIRLNGGGWGEGLVGSL